MTVSLNGENDAFEDSLPVRILAPTETVAAYGEAKPNAQETLSVPKDVVPSAGGLHVELSSTAMVGLAEGASYLIDYPYGCAEQRSSAAMALMLAGDLGEAFALPGIDAKKAKSTAQKTIYELYKFQCGDGGFAFWAGECYGESPYLTANVLHIMQRGEKLKYDVSKDVTKRAYDYLDAQAEGEAPDERRVVAGVHRVAGLRREGARRGRPQRGQPSHAALLVRRSHAGLRHLVPARCHGGQRRERSTC